MKKTLADKEFPILNRQAKSPLHLRDIIRSHIKNSPIQRILIPMLYSHQRLLVPLDSTINGIVAMDIYSTPNITLPSFGKSSAVIIYVRKTLNEPKGMILLEQVPL